MEILDDEEEKLINEEKRLIEEMNEIGNKFRTVDIVYDKVLNNIRKILLTNPKETDKKENETNTNNNDESVNNQEQSDHNKSDTTITTEYDKLLDSSKAKIKKFLGTYSKEQFEDIVKDKFKVVNINSKDKGDSTRFNSLNANLNPNVKKNLPGRLEEYDYEDNDMLEENAHILNDVMVMNKIYWNEEKRIRDIEEKEIRERKAAKNAA